MTKNKTRIWQTIIETTLGYGDISAGSGYFCTYGNYIIVVSKFSTLETNKTIMEKEHLRNFIHSEL